MHKTFRKKDFEIFDIQGLDERMQAIREHIQPVFQSIGEQYAPMVSEETGYPAAFHIAQHIRRTTNPPESTWSAIGGNKRGYKKFPHLQIGINEEYIFIFVSIIDQPLYEREMGEALLNHQENWNELSEDYVISGDHTKTKIEPLTEQTGIRLLERMLKVKKGEMMVGRIISSSSTLLMDEKAQRSFIEETITQLMPLYKQLLDTHHRLEEA